MQFEDEEEVVELSNAFELLLCEIKDEIMFKRLITDFQDPDDNVKFQALSKIGSYLTKPTNYSISAVIDNGIVPYLIECLESQRNDFQIKACFTLINLSCGTSKQTKVIVDSGAVPILIKLLKSSNLKVCEEVLWCLANIASDFRDYCIELGIIQPFINLFSLPISRDSVQNFSRMLMNLCGIYDEKIIPFLSALKLIPMIKKLLKNRDSEILLYTISAIKSLIKTEICEYIELLVENGIFKDLVLLLHHSDEKVQARIFNVFQNFSYYSNDNNQHLIDCNVLKVMKCVFETSENNTVKASLIAFLSNLAGGTVSQIQDIYDVGFIPLLIDSLENYENDAIINHEIIITFKNIITSANLIQIQVLIDSNIIPSLCKFLISVDMKYVEMVLISINLLLKKSGGNKKEACHQLKSCGGLSKIKELQKNSEMRNVATDVFKTYLACLSVEFIQFNYVFHFLPLP